MVNLSKKLEPKENTVPSYLVYAQSLSSIAPLGSASAYLTFALSYSLSSTFLAGILGALIYFLWVLIGYRYSKVIASTGGTYEFARSGGGELIGKVAGWLYWLSYATYLPSAITYLTGIVLPSEYPLSTIELGLIELLIPIALTLLLLTGVRPPLFYALVTSIIEVVIIFILGVRVLSITGFSLEPLKPSVSLSNFFSGALAVGFTLAGGGASFFLGYEAIGKGKTVGKSYIIAYWVASIAVLFASYFEIAFAGYSNSGVSQFLNVTYYPTFYIAQKYMGNGTAIVVFLFTLNSLVGSVTAAYLALSRLTFTLIKKDMVKSILTVGAFFLLINIIVSVTGDYSTVYELATEASLVTLYSSHLLVSAVYPLFTKNKLGFKFYDIPLTLTTVVLMGYGIYSNLIPYQYPSSLIGIISLVSGIIIGIIHEVLRWKRYK